ncbi:hypothetical protein BMJ34_34270 [Sinorhizobium medicae]|uniref:Secreted protein n=1 Tax=Sinorhizobium medicae TaxID=110321 RepID=A0ABX4TSH5_9HYPH|nr:hypothetical protein BMJ34_34270 [Sinorhizobium medicae]PLT86806.1 hypothetical protein BMJ35_18295 [Sinorhizobium medicae]PLU06755.1 hypothetical protein BMJ33_05945 [Sinorhizobium medicae]PLU15882.1 hypothetical protein BMJ29_24915 [Sinorhizobium medicae]PLU35517.1 hypothetical protein BMJ27_12580 [Sinorhizobium medicae]
MFWLVYLLLIRRLLPSRSPTRNHHRWRVWRSAANTWEKYSKGAYAAFQEISKSRGAGIRRGDFDLPCRARGVREKRRPSC